MPALFLDTSYLIASLNRRDALFARASLLARELRGNRFVTSDAVLTEVLAHFAGAGAHARREAAGLVHDLRNDGDVQVVPATRLLFDRALHLYELRLDKGYSLTDCMSMVVCRDRSISGVLTYDRHFEQEGFSALLR